MTEPGRFPHLFAPAQLRGHTLRCRIVFGAHTAIMVAARTAGMAFYERRVLGMRL